MWLILVLIVGVIVPISTIVDSIVKAKDARNLAETAQDNGFIDPPKKHEMEVNWQKIFNSFIHQTTSLILYALLVGVLLGGRINSIKLFLLWIPFFLIGPVFDHVWQEYVVGRRASMKSIRRDGEHHAERNFPILILIVCQLVVDIMSSLR